METLLVREVQGGQHGNDRVGVAIAQVFVHGPGVDDVAGVENVVRIKVALDLAVQAVKLGAKETLVHPAAGAAIAVFTAERSAIAVQKIHGKVHDLRHFRDFPGHLGVDERSDVKATGAGVGVVGHPRAQAVTELLKFGDVLRQMVGRNGGILDEGNRLVVAADAHHETQSDLAHGPDVFLSRGINDRDGDSGIDILCLQMTLEAIDFGLQLPLTLTVELGDENAIRVAIDEGPQQPGVLGHVAAKRQSQMVQQFDRRGPRLQHRRHGRQRREEIVVVDDGQGRHARQGHEIEFQFRQDAQRAFCATEQLRQVEILVLGPIEADSALNEAVKVVAATAAPVTRCAVANDVGVVARQARHFPIDVALQPVTHLVLTQGVISKRPHARAGPVGQNDLGLQQMVGRHAIQDGMTAGGVVGNDAPHRRPVAAGGVWPELQAMRLERQVQFVQHEPRPHPHPTFLRVDFVNAIKPAR